MSRAVLASIRPWWCYHIVVQRYSRKIIWKGYEVLRGMRPVTGSSWTVVRCSGSMRSDGVSLDQRIAEAKEMGMSYGQYMAYRREKGFPETQKKTKLILETGTVTDGADVHTDRRCQ